LICGCGGQAAAQLRALFRVRKPRRLLAYDRDGARASAFAALMAKELSVPAAATGDLEAACAASRAIVTCTTSQRYFITRGMVMPGTFIAAVGADNENKQEIEPALMAHATVVTDVTAQACTIGDLHHAIAAGAMSRGQVHAELGEIIAGKKRGRTSPAEVVVFDSTGTGLQDVAAAIAAYRHASRERAGMSFNFSGSRNER
jgi:ornithine cyclodeaminase/alanine dehydrogenase-like protein (mu-crystallin family)